MKTYTFIAAMLLHSFIAKSQSSKFDPLPMKNGKVYFEKSITIDGSNENEIYKYSNPYYIGLKQYVIVDSINHIYRLDYTVKSYSQNSYNNNEGFNLKGLNNSFFPKVKVIVKDSLLTVIFTDIL